MSVAGIVNFSITKSSTPSSLLAASVVSVFELCTTMYLGCRSPSAEIFAGSRVSVAEKSSFWQDDSLGSSMSVRTYGTSRNRWRKAGANASGWGRAECVDDGATSGCVVDKSSEGRGGRVAASTWASQSWKDCASRRSASSMTYRAFQRLQKRFSAVTPTRKRRCCNEKFGVPCRWSIKRPGVQMRMSTLLEPPCRLGSEVSRHDGETRRCPYSTPRSATNCDCS